jgi:hypothetical protein
LLLLKQVRKCQSPNCAGRSAQERPAIQREQQLVYPSAWDHRHEIQST